MHNPRNKNLTAFAKDLRKNMTKEERHLWYDFLRHCSPRFRRQEIIGNYIADFYCHSAKLVIELDGSRICSRKMRLMMLIVPLIFKHLVLPLFVTIIPTLTVIFPVYVNIFWIPF